MQSTTTKSAISVVVFYSSKDEHHLEMLEAFLAPLIRSGRIQLWYDRKTEPGDVWRRTRDAYLSNADLILLLITSNFIASSECDYEAQQSLARHQSEGTSVIPIYVDHVDWNNTLFAHMHRLPSDRYPVLDETHRTASEAWATIAKDISAETDNLIQSHVEIHSAREDIALYLGVMKELCITLPFGVLHSATGIDRESLTSEFERLEESGTIHMSGELCTVLSTPFKITPNILTNSSAKLLAHLLVYTQLHSGTSLASSQSRNLLTLGRACARDHLPVATVFSTIDEDAKNFGDKLLVFELAKLSIEAAQAATPRTIDLRRHEARARICGKGWVYQRIRRLNEALTETELGQQIAEDIGDRELQALAMKSLGRIRRLQAEDLNAREPAFLLDLSEELLTSAIEIFQSLYAIADPRRDLQVGDCWSLLGRTYFVGRKMQKSAEAVQSAYQHLRKSSTKPYVDLLLLDAERELFSQNLNVTQDRLEEAGEVILRANAEESEMSGRLHFALGRLWKARDHLHPSRRTGDHAIAEFTRAAQIYTRLNELEAAANAHWEKALAEKSVPKVLYAVLELEPRPILRVAILEEFRAAQDSTKTNNSKHRVRSSRENSPHEQLSAPEKAELIARARNRIAVEYQPW